MNTRQLAKNLLLISLAAVAMCVAPAGAQLMTEKFIPIGQSPGISGKYSVIGTIVEVDRATHTMSVEHAGGVKVVRVTDATHIWLDRSKRRRQNTTGAYEDCEVGRSVEVMHLRDDESTAAWIKIEAQ